MATGTINIIVEKIKKERNKIIHIDKLKKIISNVLGDKYTNQKIYKHIHTLKNRGYIITLKKKIYLIKDQDQDIAESHILNTYYWPVLGQHCKEFIYSKRYIGGVKALELNIQNFDIPDEIVVLNETKQSVETVMFDKQLFLKTYSHKSKSLLKLFYKFTYKIKIGKYSFQTANIELAILESLFNPSVVNKGYINELVKKVLKKNKKNLDYKIRELILKNNKHNSSLNRLYHLSQHVDPKITENIKFIIKKYGYFVNV